MKTPTHALRKEAAEAIVDSLDHYPQEWSWNGSIDDKVSITHLPSQIQIWVNNGGYYVYKPNQVKFSFWDRCKIRRAVKRWRKSCGDQQADACERTTCHHVIDKLS